MAKIHSKGPGAPGRDKQAKARKDLATTAPKGTDAPAAREGRPGPAEGEVAPPKGRPPGKESKEAKDAPDPRLLDPLVGMDAVSAHLDRGWDLLHRADYRGAKLSAEQVLEENERSPEGYVLLGAIAAAEGDPENALLRYEHAAHLDPGFIDPLLYAAEVYIWPLGQCARAVELCEQALDLAEEEDEFLDALLLKAEAELGTGDADAARRTLRELPEVDLPEGLYHLRAARTLLELGQIKEAEQHFQRAVHREPQLSDAVHGLGLCAEERGDRKAMIKHWLEVRERDLVEPAVPWAISSERFEELCTQALQGLPERIRELLINVPIVAAEYPSEELVKEGHDPRMLGFFAGVPYPEKTSVGGAPHPDCILLFQRNLERMSQSVEDLEEEIRKTLFHEAGHFFGLSEEELEEMGLG